MDILNLFGIVCMPFTHGKAAWYIQHLFRETVFKKYSFVCWFLSSMDFTSTGSRIPIVSNYHSCLISASFISVLVTNIRSVKHNWFTWGIGPIIYCPTEHCLTAFKPHFNVILLSVVNFGIRSAPITMSGHY